MSTFFLSLTISLSYFKKSLIKKKAVYFMFHSKFLACAFFNSEALRAYARSILILRDSKSGIPHQTCWRRLHLRSSERSVSVRGKFDFYFLHFYYFNTFYIFWKFFLIFLKVQIILNIIKIKSF